MNDTVYYAIGDVHGEDELLAQLHGFIFDDAEMLGVKPFIVHLGDLIDRGPNSRGVVERVMRLEQKHDSICIKGNHEELMLHAYDRADSIGLYHWATNGGDETIKSYAGRNTPDSWKDVIDPDHVAWMRKLPTIWRDEARRIVFVHGGIDPKKFPKCTDEVRLWTRSSNFFNTKLWPNRPELEGLLVVHGHTPQDDLKIENVERRINIDTGACFGGPLTSVVLAPQEAPRFLRVQR